MSGVFSRPVARVHEVCSCGAEFTVTTMFAIQAQEAAAEWRANHKHGADA
jgi:hypothetical protein